jgi:hypothetical protein
MILHSSNLSDILSQSNAHPPVPAITRLMPTVTILEVLAFIAMEIPLESRIGKVRRRSALPAVHAVTFARNAAVTQSQKSRPESRRPVAIRARALLRCAARPSLNIHLHYDPRDFGIARQRHIGIRRIERL